MTTLDQEIEVGGIQIKVVKKDIKNLHLAVYPPTGSVRVAAPLTADDDTIRMSVVTHLGWILRHQRNFINQERQSQREFTAGESHYVQGKRLRLKLTSGKQVAVNKVGKSTLEMQTKPAATKTQLLDTLNTWYRKDLQSIIDDVSPEFAKVMEITMPTIQIRKMKNRWGTCNPAKEQISLNLELAKKSKRCVEYILVHEMVHLLEQHHNENFQDLMTKFLPTWRTLRDELNSAPLSANT